MISKSLFLFAAAIASTAAAQTTQPSTWDTYSDTWVATDDLGRSLPTEREVGPPKQDRTVGIFYYLWLPGDQKTHAGPFDNTKILLQDPNVLSNPQSPLLGGEHAFQHWGEPLFGYYRIFDDYVLRKHAQMLADAGVDVVFFDTTNSYNYFDQVAELTKVWNDLEAQGQKVPKFVFTCRHAKGDRQAKQVQLIYDTIYKNPIYKPRFFYWDGKPLILAARDPDRMPADVLSYFTFRDILWAHTPMAKATWSLDNSIPYSDGNDRLGLDENGTMEEMAAAVAVSNAGGPDSHLSPYNSRAYHGRIDGGHLETDAQATARGGQFQDEFDFLLKHDPQPKLALIYDWNEWISQEFIKDGGVYFVDEFSEDHSKDIEPMLGGHGDDYYYQMIANIRKYHGVRSIQPVRSAPIQLDGKFDDWDAVTPEYRDTIGDTAHRDCAAFGDRVPKYTNNTGRNDLKSAKVSAIGDKIYFLIRTNGPLIVPDGAAKMGDWMTLYIDADHDPKTGWLGYDLRVSPGRKTIEQYAGNPVLWRVIGTIQPAVGNDGIELAIPRALISGNSFDFKWTDNCYQHGDWTDFTLNGDAAPNDRFNYRAILP